VLDSLYFVLTTVLDSGDLCQLLTVLDSLYFVLTTVLDSGDLCQLLTVLDSELRNGPSYKLRGELNYLTTSRANRLFDE
jgi:hypothetical protein